MDNLKKFIKTTIREFLNENNTQSDRLVFVYDPNSGEIKGYNLKLHSDEFNKVLYDENGRSQGFGWGGQINDKNEPIKFTSIESAQKWHSDREEKHLIKQTQNNSYPDLSNIALQLRKFKDINFQIINRGSCFKFAKEISKLGYKNFTFIFSEEDQEAIHVYIKLSENLYWDAIGFHTKKEIKSAYDIGGESVMYDGDISELNEYCDIDTYGALSTIPISDETWKKIVQIIKNNKK